MKFETKIRTQSKDQVDSALPVKTASRKIRLESREGVSFPTHLAFKRAGLSATVRYPISNDDNESLVPSNPIRDFVLAKQALRENKLANPGELEIEVTASEDILDNVIELIQSGGVVAANKDRQPVLPASPRSDEPKNEKVVSDQKQPVESGAKAASEVTVDGKRYVLVEVPEQKSDKPSAEAVVEEIPEEIEKEDTTEEKEDKTEAAEVKDEKEEAEDKEAKLLDRLAVAELSVEMGLVPANEKMKLVASLEAETDEAVEARRITLEQVREAGLAKSTRTARVRGGELTRVPRLERATLHHGNAENGSIDDIPVEAIFMS